MTALDYKKTNRNLYSPGPEASLIEVPAMNFIMLDGKCDPNEEGGEYGAAIELLFGLSYGIKMSLKKGPVPDGYSDYVVPPLEGLWWACDDTMDFTDKSKFVWTSMIRQPDFISSEMFDRACQNLMAKKKTDASKARFVTWEEGLCAQVMHIGTYDQESASIAKIVNFVKAQGLSEDIGDTRKHHEIYLSDMRKVSPDKMKTIIRHPVRR